MNKQELEKTYPSAIWYKDGFSVEKARYGGGAGQVQASIVEKPWGFEVWLFYTRRYALKYLIINKGSRLSLQSHEQKEESWKIEQGHPYLILGEKVVKASVGQMFHVAPGTIHRISAIDDDVAILEVSSPELWDVKRHGDDYSRGSVAE